MYSHNGGSYTLSASVSDAAGNPATVHNSSSFTVNTAAPTVQSATLSWGEVLNAAESSVDGTVTVLTSGVDDGQTLTVTINGASMTNTTAQRARLKIRVSKRS